jgi:hypothetical protein
MRLTLKPSEPAPILDLVDHICTADEATSLLTFVLQVGKACLEHGGSAECIDRASDEIDAALRLRNQVETRYAPGNDLTREDASAVAASVERIGWLVSEDAREYGTLDIQNAAAPLSELVAVLLERTPCPTHAEKRSAARWWLIPLALLGAGLVVYSETRGKRR